MVPSKLTNRTIQSPECRLHLVRVHTPSVATDMRPSNEAVVLELNDGVVHSVGNRAEFHVHTELRPQLERRASRTARSNHARTVE